MLTPEEMEFLKPFFERLSSALDECINDSDPVQEILNDVKKVGYVITPTFELGFEFHKIDSSETKEPKALVNQDGNTDPKLFTRTDMKWLRRLDFAFKLKPRPPG